MWLRIQTRRAAIARGVVAVAIVLVFAAAAAATFIVARTPSANTTSSTSEATVYSFPSRTTASSTTSTSSATTSSTDTSTSSSKSSSSASALASLTIFDFGGDVIGPGSNFISFNMTQVYDNSLYLGNPGDDIPVEFQIFYNTCGACPMYVTNVTVLTPGFSILLTTPNLPIAGNVTSGAPGTGTVSFDFYVTVVAPMTTFNGDLTLLATTSYTDGSG